MAQYKVVEVKLGLTNQREKIETEINKMAQEKWELVTATPYVLFGASGKLYLIGKKG